MTKEFLKAKPVWKKEEESTKNATCVFYTKFFAETEQVTIRIACCNVYKLYLNGEFISIGPARAAHGYYRMDELHISCRYGENVLFVEVAAYNTNNYCYLNSAGFLQAEIIIGGVPAAWTGEHFLTRSYEERLRKVSRYSYQRSFLEVYNFVNNPYSVYANPQVDGKSYENPKIVGGGKIIERVVSYMEYKRYNAKKIEEGIYKFLSIKPQRNIFTDDKRLGIYSPEEWETFACDVVSDATYQKQKLGNSLNRGEYVLYDFSAAETGYLHTKFQVRKDCVIYYIFDSIDLRLPQDSIANINCFRNQGFDIVEYRVKEGDFEHITIEPYVMRYLKILVVEGEISDLEVEIRGCENPDTERFYFMSENEKLNKIVDAGIRTFKANAVDLLTDCPSRERAGWLCDSFFLAKTEQLLTGKNIVEQAFLENYYLTPAYPTLPKGMLPMCYPADFTGTQNIFIPNWALWYIVEVFDNFERTGNFLQAHFAKEKIYQILDYFLGYENEDELLENLDGWVFIEWSKANDQAFIRGVNYPSNMLYVKALRLVGTLYQDVALTEKANRIQEKIIKQSFNGEFFEDNRIRKNGKLCKTGNISETCQYYAFFSGIACKKEYSDLYEILRDKFGSQRDVTQIYPNIHKSNAFIGNYLRLIMLMDEDEYAQIPTECVDFFYNMAIKTGTLWEHDKYYGSLNHGFASFAVYILVAYITGYQGLKGNKLFFKRCCAQEDCEVHLPLENEEMIFIRKNGKTTLRFPEGYEIVELPL